MCAASFSRDGGRRLQVYPDPQNVGFSAYGLRGIKRGLGFEGIILGLGLGALEPPTLKP